MTKPTEQRRVDAIKLKPCPFCGGEAILTTTNYGSMIATCKDCFVDGGATGCSKTASDSWNARPYTEKLEAENARLREALGRVGNKLVSFKETALLSRAENIRIDGVVDIIKQALSEGSE